MLSIIIPAAGYGRRFSSHGGVKPLVQLPDGETVLSRQVRLLRKKFPAAEIILVVGFEGARVIKATPSCCRIVENELYEQSNVARSTSLGLRVCSGHEVLIVLGDLVFEENFLEFPLDKSCVLTERSDERRYEVGINVSRNKVGGFSYGVPVRWGGVVYLQGKELELFKQYVHNRKNARWFLWEVLQKIVDRSGQFKAIEAAGRVVEIDRPMDVKTAWAMLQQGESD